MNESRVVLWQNKDDGGEYKAMTLSYDESYYNSIKDNDAASTRETD